MTPEPYNEPPGAVKKEQHPVFQITPISKYLALILFVLLPFIGGYIGYQHAPENIVTVTKVLPASEELESQSVIGVTQAEVVDGDVMVTFSSGESKIVAQQLDETEVEQYFDIERYQEVFISPNRAFVALQGIGFEDSFIRVYNVQEDRLESTLYGEVSGWDNAGRLSVISCNLAGEDCTRYISTSADRPWVLEERE